MRTIRHAMVGLLLCAPAIGAQRPDTTARGRQRADSIAKAVRDSIELMKELGAAMAAPDTARAAGAGAQSAAAVQRLLPDISAVGDFVADLSPQGSTQEDGARFSIREVELAAQAVVDPYFRGDIFLGISDLEGIAIEQAFLTTTSLPNELELKIGRFLLPFGKQNLTHRHDLHTTEYPWVIQRFLGAEGLKGTGLWGSRVFAPFGFYQELQVTAIDRLSPAEDLVTTEPVNKSLGGLGFSARLRNYVDITEAANVELSFSALTGKRARPLSGFFPFTTTSNGVTTIVPVNAIAARQSLLGADLTWRWRPLQQGLYESFILQAEVMHQRNDPTPTIPAGLDCGAGGCAAELGGPARDLTGAYVFARYQTTQRTFLGARYDWVQDPERDGGTLTAGSVYLEWYPSEFSKLSAGYEGYRPAGETLLHRVLLQATFALGPHKPHPF